MATLLVIAATALFVLFLTALWIIDTLVELWLWVRARFNRYKP